jgi:hypothetical protein
MKYHLPSFSRSFYFILSPLYFSHSFLFTLYFPLVFRLGLSFFSSSNGEINKHTHTNRKNLLLLLLLRSHLCIYVTNEGDNSTNTTSRLKQFGRMLSNLTDGTTKIEEKKKSSHHSCRVNVYVIFTH